MRGLGIPAVDTALVVNLESKAKVEDESKETDTKKCKTCILNVANTFLSFYDFFKLKGQDSSLKHLVNFALGRQGNENVEKAPLDYQAFFATVVKKTATLAANWHTQGYCHGGITPSCISIDGECLDFGPGAFMDIYDPDFNSNPYDHMGSQKFSNQPKKLRQFCGTLGIAMGALLLPTFDEKGAKEFVNASLETNYDSVFEQVYWDSMREYPLRRGRI